MLGCDVTGKSLGSAHFCPETGIPLPPRGTFQCPSFPTVSCVTRDGFLPTKML